MSAYFVATDTVTAMVAAGLGHTEPNLVGNAAANPLRWWTTSMHCMREQLQGGDRMDQFRRELRSTNATEVGQMLLAENLRSMDARYGLEGSNNEDAIAEFAGYQGTIDEYEYPSGGWIYRLSAGDVLGCIDDFTYQACEASDWEDTEAHSFCQNLEQMIYKQAIPTRAWGLGVGELAKRKTGARNLSSMMGG